MPFALSLFIHAQVPNCIMNTCTTYETDIYSEIHLRLETKIVCIRDSERVKTDRNSITEYTN